MALESEVNFKAAVAAAAVQLTTALQDTVLTELAPPVKHPMHPLRDILKLFVLNASTGVFTANDDYISGAFDGQWPYKGAGMNDIGPPTPLAVVSATIEDASPSDIVLTMNQNVSLTEIMTIAGTVTTEKTISSISLSGAVVTITVSSPYIVTDSAITVSGVVHGTALNQITLDGQAVTNNVT